MISISASTSTWFHLWSACKFFPKKESEDFFPKKRMSSIFIFFYKQRSNDYRFLVEGTYKCGWEKRIQIPMLSLEQEFHIDFFFLFLKAIHVVTRISEWHDVLGTIFDDSDRGSLSEIDSERVRRRPNKRTFYISDLCFSAQFIELLFLPFLKTCLLNKTGNIDIVMNLGRWLFLTTPIYKWKPRKREVLSMTNIPT